MSCQSAPGANYPLIPQPLTFKFFFFQEKIPFIDRYPLPLPQSISSLGKDTGAP
ncbi:unnamed protein product [Staurois parvus]|uniref:Uncharacterized protein n=1 Tax=Staurois parvus TaxID=386267 RepID=A0ABN9DI19_9NEOB|nr:unnamed protein product [Staurois parvus]